MTAAAPDELLAQWSRLLLGGLVRAGVRDLVASPGSRSTPFLWAALHQDGLACHPVYDERSAAFYALGRARVSGQPVALLCTSGSAAANYFPAIVEASLARVPLVVVTADRPLELQDAAAAQTIDQIKLYGGYVRRFYELGAPDENPSALSGTLRLVQQAVAASLEPEPGPVHLNARARKPLEPPLPAAPSELAARVSALLDRPPTVLAPSGGAPAPRAIEALAAACRGARSGLIVCGPEPVSDAGELSALRALSERSGFPLLCEATSQLRFSGPAAGQLDAFDWILRQAELRTALAPDVVLRFGAPPTSGALELLLASAREYHLIARHGFPDALGRAQSLTLGSSAAIAGALTALLRPSAATDARAAYAERWARLNGRAWAAVETALSAPGFHEGAAVRTAVDAVPRGGLLVLGNSLPVREVDQYVRAGDRELFVSCQRGANGIDGVVSGAAGGAAASGRPTLLLIGDVSFLHDLNGLDLVRRAERPLLVVVIDNGGGRIFDQLPLGPRLREQPALERFWLTPPSVELRHAAALFELSYAEASSASELAAAARDAFARNAASVIVARVAPNSAREAVAAVGLALAGEHAP